MKLLFRQTNQEAIYSCEFDRLGFWKCRDKPRHGPGPGLNPRCSECVRTTWLFFWYAECQAPLQPRRWEDDVHVIPGDLYARWSLRGAPLDGSSKRVTAWCGGPRVPSAGLPRLCSGNHQHLHPPSGASALSWVGTFRRECAETCSPRRASKHVPVIPCGLMSDSCCLFFNSSVLTWWKKVKACLPKVQK